MSRWRATKASRVFAALQRIGWSVKREAKGSHKVLEREGFPHFAWAFHDRDGIGPKTLARIAEHDGPHAGGSVVLPQADPRPFCPWDDGAAGSRISAAAWPRLVAPSS